MNSDSSHNSSTMEMPSYPAFQFLTESVLLDVSFVILTTVLLRRLVDLAQCQDEAGAASTLPFVAVGVAVGLMGADEVRQIGKLHHHLKRTKSIMHLYDYNTILYKSIQYNTIILHSFITWKLHCRLWPQYKDNKTKDIINNYWHILYTVEIAGQP